MLAHINIYDLLFIDIETVPRYSTHEELSLAMRELWAIKHGFLKRGDETPAQGYLKCAGVYAEFAKVVCITIGYFHEERQLKQKLFRIKSFSGDDEKELLSQFTEILNKRFDYERYHFC